jgi:hypothetical protein
MSSELRRPARRLGAWAAAAALLLGPALAGCGKEGPPAPPLRSVPAATRNLAAHQQGAWILLEFEYPKLTPAGAVLGGVSAVEVWRAERPAPDGRVIPVTPREFEVAAKLALRLEPEDVSLATFGDQILVALPLEEPAITTPVARYYAVRTFSAIGDRSDLSNVASLVPQAPPAPPEPASFTGRPDGVLVEWSPVEGALGYNVYRRDARERRRGTRIHAAGPEERSFLDTSARFGQDYIYSVTAVGAREPLIESAQGSEREIRYQDRFPPPAPRELVPLAEPGRVRLVWQASAAADLVGYHVYRRTEAGRFERVTESPASSSEFLDDGVTTGRTYGYRVTAVDELGNESAPSEVVFVAVP